MAQNFLNPVRTSVVPWLSVPDPARAERFYEVAFGALKVYPADGKCGPVARLSIDGAEFWIAEESPSNQMPQPSTSRIRMILTVSDPDALFAQALRAGATEVYPITEAHGWRIGRLADPFGHHWELGHPLTP